MNLPIDMSSAVPGNEPDESPGLPRSRALLATFVLALTSLCFTLVLVEGLIRVMDYWQAKTSVAISKRARTIASSRYPERPSRYFVPSGSVSLRGNGTPEHFSEAPVRVAVVGDSFTFAPRMQADDAFPARLERLLNLNKDAPRAAVLNLGSPGFSTYAEVNVVKGILARHPTLVILQVTLNDAQLRRLQDEPPEIRGAFGPYQPVGWVGWLTTYWRTLSLILGRIHNERSHQAYIRYHENLFVDSKTKGIFDAALKDIARLCEEAKVPLAVVVFPLFDFPIDAKYPFSKVHGAIVATTDALGIPTLDLRDAYQGLDVRRLQLIPGVDSHPNEIAHRVAAEEIMSFLFKKSLLPEDLKPHLSFRSRENMRMK